MYTTQEYGTFRAKAADRRLLHHSFLGVLAMTNGSHPPKPKAEIQPLRKKPAVSPVRKPAKRKDQ